MMDRMLFRKKYLGEVNLKTGEHVKFLFPVTEMEIFRAQIAAETVWHALHKPNANFRDYEWAFLDDLNLSQFRIVFTNIRKYGKNYWCLVWKEYLTKNKK